MIRKPPLTNRTACPGTYNKNHTNTNSTTNWFAVSNVVSPRSHQERCKEPETPDMWRDRVKSLQRPSSSTLEAFLLPTDDPRVHRAREDLAASTRENRKVTDWGRCESRHQVQCSHLLGTT